MDNINKRILDKLQSNARLSLAELGRSIGLSAPSITERIQKMEKTGVIAGYEAKLDLDKLGYNTQAIIALKSDSQGCKRFINNLSEFPEVFECLKITGEYCLQLKAAVKNNKELESLIDRISEYGQPTTSIIFSDYTNNVSFAP